MSVQNILPTKHDETYTDPNLFVFNGLQPI